MYRRLPKVSRDMEELGLLHIRNQEVMMRRMVRGGNIVPLQVLCSAIGPLQGYKRHSQGVAYSTDLPLTRLPDIAVPDPQLPRDFMAAVEACIAKPDDALQQLLIGNWLEMFKSNHAELEGLAKNAPALRPVLPLSAQLRDVAIVGSGLLEMLVKGEADESRKENYRKAIEAARKPVQECEILIVDAIARLYEKVYGK
jgi:hexosaminidase